jgi:hypothetical protein
MKDEGEMMNESSIRFPLFDLDFQLLTCNFQLKKNPCRGAEGLAFSPNSYFLPYAFDKYYYRKH